ncbi:MAG: NADH-quinone oxidoreductase subunit I [Proteobacteria bacterium]|nr:NADH-quinone oxidoreductase subunit I [Pseudomonadota bacterium]
MKASYFEKVGIGIKTVVKGMAKSLTYFFKKPVTLQYPHVRKKIAERYRGSIRLKIDPETGKFKCIACTNCEKICPAFAITLKTETPEGSKKKELKEFYVDLGRCIYCGLCVDSCPVDAIEHSNVYEVAERIKDNLILRLDKIGEKNV